MNQSSTITGNIINMAGIEQAFKDFVKRVSEKENQEQVSEERGYQYGGGAIGYSDGGYPPVEDPYLADEFLNYQTSGLPKVSNETNMMNVQRMPERVQTENMGIAGYPISFGNLGIRPRVNIQGPTSFSPDPYTKISTSNQNYGGDIGYKLTDNLNATGSIDYNRSKTRQDYNVPYFDQYGNKVFEDKGSMNNIYKSPADIRLGLNYQTPQTNANISINPRSRDLMARYNYSFANGGYISQGELVDTDLTRTIPPDRGPNPQGVETLFKRRYS